MPERELLWRAENQAARLRELTTCDPELKEAPLRRDVRSLGMLLGDVIKEQAGVGVYEAEEEIRRLAIRHRELTDGQDPTCLDLEAEHDLQDRAVGIVKKMTVAEMYQIAKAFGTYFELTNLAETNHRMRAAGGTAFHGHSGETGLDARHPATHEGHRHLQRESAGMAQAGGGGPGIHRPSDGSGTAGGPL